MGIDASERDELTRELARLALHRAAPDELVIFDDLAVEYFADPPPRCARRTVTRPSASGWT